MSSLARSGKKKSKPIVEKDEEIDPGILTIKQKIAIQERIDKYNIRIKEKEDAMIRELIIIEERNNNNEPSAFVKITNLLKCQTNKSQMELNFERINKRRQLYLKSNNIVEEEHVRK